MQAREPAADELRFEMLHRVAQQVSRLADVHLDVIAGRFDPVDLGNVDEENPAAGTDDQAPRPLSIAAQPFEQRREARVDPRALPEIRFGAAERALEARSIERLEEIVAGVAVEG